MAREAWHFQLKKGNSFYPLFIDTCGSEAGNVDLFCERVKFRISLTDFSFSPMLQGHL